MPTIPRIGRRGPRRRSRSRVRKRLFLQSSRGLSPSAFFYGFPQLWFGPGITQRYRSVENGCAGLRVSPVGDKVSMSLELKAIVAPRFLQRRLQVRRDDMFRIGIDVVQVLVRSRAGLRLAK